MLFLNKLNNNIKEVGRYGCWDQSRRTSTFYEGLPTITGMKSTEKCCRVDQNLHGADLSTHVKELLLKSFLFFNMVCGDDYQMNDHIYSCWIDSVSFLTIIHKLHAAKIFQLTNTEYYLSRARTELIQFVN